MTDFGNSPPVEPVLGRKAMPEFLGKTKGEIEMNTMTKSTGLRMGFRFLGLMGVMGFMFLGGCASMFMGGGRLVSRNSKPREVVVNYRAEGAVPPNVTYQLVQTEKGLAMFERSADGSGALLETRWTDEAGDHFAGWVRTSHAYEFVVPAERTKPVKGFVYAKGYYTFQNIDGVNRPVPTVKIGPVRTLHPTS